jgi:O-antigen/teichoic acid export membrane protein
LASNIFTAVLAFALLPVLTRHLSPSEYGVAGMFATLAGMCTAVVGVNGVAASARRHHDMLPRQEFAEYMGACVQIVAVSGFVTLAAVLALRGQLSALLGLETGWLAWAVLASIFAVLVQLVQAHWQVRGAFRSSALQQSGEAAATTLLSLLLVVVLHRGGAGRITATILSGAVFALLALVLLHRTGLMRIATWRPAHVADILRYGVPLVPHVAAGFVLTAADRIVVTSELGIAQAGIYMLAAHLAQAGALVFDAINKAYVPWLFERLQSGDTRIKSLIVRYTYAWFALLLALGWLAFYVGPWLVALVGGERYADARTAIGWLLLGQVFAGMYLMVTNYVFYAKRTGLLSAVTVASGALNILLLLVLTPRLGIEGAAMAFSIAMGVRFLLTWWAAQRSHPMPWFAHWTRATTPRPG